MASRVPYKNRSPTGWWVAQLVERFEFEDEDLSNPRRRCLAWVNTVVFKSNGRELAYKKAQRIGEEGQVGGWSTEKGRKGHWVFEGVASVLPVYDEFDPDGSEVFFDAYENVTVGRVQSWTTPKEQLPLFDDSEP